jgi:hypothetical protein
MKKAKAEKVVPKMPEGISVAERPVGLEFMQRGNERWTLVIQGLEALDSTHCINIAIDGLSKNQINGIKASIKHAGNKLGYTKKIKFAVKGNLLYIWSNN